MGRFRALSIAVSLISVACVYKPPAVRLIGEPGSLETLVGEWTGGYTVDHDSERRGQISFTLIAGEDHAYGDVLMLPKGTRLGYERAYGGQPPHPDTSRRSSTVLSIRFVRVLDRGVSGLLDAYWDPERNCRVWTTFDGDLKGGVIEGTFRSHFSDFRPEENGHWRVTRRVTAR